MKIHFVGICSLLLTALMIAAGCGNINKSQFHGKTFTIRAELKQGAGVEVLVWRNASRLERDKEGYGYTFYVNGKLVALDPQGTVVIEEQSEASPQGCTKGDPSCWRTYERDPAEKRK
jgi:hypothetical protein